MFFVLKALNWECALVSGKPFIGIDWGTSSMRAMLCTPDREAPDSNDVILGAGISKLDRPIGDVLLDIIRPWEDRFGQLSVIMAGMVGSNIGWHNTGYVNCPSPLVDLIDHAKTFAYHGREISILPGVRCQNQMGEPDLMRGEEVQLSGWLANNKTASQHDRLYCLPGTHCKWATMKDGRLETFTTSLTGEVFAILQKHSVLVPDYRESNQKPFDLDSFLRGVDLIFDHPVSLLPALFSTRSRWISSAGDFGDPSSYLSGILIGSDINAALSNGGHSYSTVEIIGEPSLCKKYADAMLRIGRKSRITDGVLSSYSGFRSLKPN